MSEQDTSTTGVIEVPVTIDLNQHLNRYRGIDPETGHELSEAQTIEDLVLERAAQIVAARAIADGTEYSTVRKRAESAVQALVEDRIADAIEAFMATPRVPTDTWGNPKGEPVTFAETVQSLVESTLTKAQNADPYDRNKRPGTLIERTIGAAVEDTVTREVQAAVTEQKNQILKQVTASAAAVLAEGVKRGLDRAVVQS